MTDRISILELREMAFMSEDNPDEYKKLLKGLKTVLTDLKKIVDDVGD